MKSSYPNNPRQGDFNYISSSNRISMYKHPSVKNIAKTFENLSTLPLETKKKQEQKTVKNIKTDEDSKPPRQAPVHTFIDSKSTNSKSIFRFNPERHFINLNGVLAKSRANLVEQNLIPEFQGTDKIEMHKNTVVEDGLEAGEALEASRISNRDIFSRISASSDWNENDFSIDIMCLYEKNRRQLSNVVQELINTEKIYVEHLENGIKSYVRLFDDRVKDYPPLLGKKYDLFGNIEEIYEFHKKELLPSLNACNGDMIFIANIFNTFIKNDRFYDYVLFALTRTRATQLELEHNNFLQEITRATNDILGLNSFLVKPAQRLGRYKLLFGEIIVALAKDHHAIKNVKDLLSACCIVEKQLERLLDNVNEAISLNDIEQTIEKKTSVIDGLPENFGLYLSLPCGKFDLIAQGKFRKMSVFTVYGSNVGKKRFFGKVFLFEKSMLCTEFIDYSTKLRYRNHIPLDQITQIDTVDKDTFKIITKNKKITFFSGSLYENEKWIEQLWKLKETGCHAERVSLLGGTNVYLSELSNQWMLVKF